MRHVDIFHIGPQKSATTWLYYCLKEHPEVGLPPKDSIHYYDMLYHKGAQWYAHHFDHLTPDLKIVDPTPSYFRSRLAPMRIANDFPEAKIVLCLRNPIERAFSHYWHEKKKMRFNYKFSEVLENYDLYSSWIETGFYSRFIGNYLGVFHREQILCQIFDNLVKDAHGFLNELLKFIEVSTDFEPTVLNQKINTARAMETATVVRSKNVLRSLLKSAGLLDLVYRFTGILRSFRNAANSNGGDGRMENLSDQPEFLLDELRRIYTPEIDLVEDLMSIDLKHWKAKI